MDERDFHRRSHRIIAQSLSPNHYGSEQPFRLPYSGVRGTISSGLNQPVTARDTRSTIEPDIALPSSAADHFARRDPVLERAIVTLRDRTATSGGN